MEGGKKVAVIIGAGPAGLTAAYELLTRTDIVPIVLEADDTVGGICKTINYKGNRMDIGGHRFFSKSDRVINWWLNIFPLQSNSSKNLTLSYHNNLKQLHASTEVDPEKTDIVMLVRERNSRIYSFNHFFDYPIKLNFATLQKLGFIRTTKIALSYLKSLLFPIKPEKNLEYFFINRFGKELYQTFFKSYTEKVWGQKCTEISADWGRQRIKGLSIAKSIAHFIKSIFPSSKNIEQKNTETSLIQYFLYPKLGPGQFWDEVAKLIIQKGGKIILNTRAEKVITESNTTTEVIARNSTTKETSTLKADYVFSTMPVKDLIQGMNGISVPVNNTAEGLVYRDFLSVGILLKKFNDQNPAFTKKINDNWIYIQQQDVKVGRIQVFNNWSPYMVHDKDKIWIGLEYFCNAGDELWNMTDDQLKKYAGDELVKMNMALSADIIDGTVVRMPKAYPAYFGSYTEFDQIKKYTDTFQNLFLIGRNGMHKYNNQDHSMLTAMVAVDNIVNGISSKENIWEVNTEEEYQEG